MRIFIGSLPFHESYICQVRASFGQLGSQCRSDPRVFGKLVSFEAGLRLGALTRLADKLLHALLTSVHIRVRLHLPSGLNVCAQIAHAICKVAAAAEINPRIESEAQAFFQASGAEHAMAQTDCRYFPTKRQTGICNMALRSILTLPTENTSYPISAKSSSTQLGSPPSERIISL